MVEVVWLGHACFMLKGKTKNVIFDPFKGTGLPEPTVKADIILCSHSHSDHNNADAVKRENSVILEEFKGSKTIDSISVRGVAAYHDESQGGKRGENSVYIVSLDDLVFCHLGDLGHELSKSQVSEIGKVDVLFIPVGGFFTINPQQARAIMASISPRITIPMHYKMSGMDLLYKFLKGVDDFVRTSDNTKRLDGPDFTVRKDDLPEKPLIIIPRLVN